MLTEQPLGICNYDFITLRLDLYGHFIPHMPSLECYQLQNSKEEPVTAVAAFKCFPLNLACQDRQVTVRTSD